MVRKLEVPGLTETVLRHLYLEERLTETEIGERFGIGQVQIGRIRQRMGIPTMSKGDRIAAQLPARLTDIQHQLIVGSLLGDGWMRATGAQSAGFSEGHCEAQADYTRWKAEILKEFIARISPTVKKTAEKEFHALCLATHSCHQLRHYYDLFYPAPEHKRIFPASLPDLMTSFVLAVWYLDDGSVSKRGEPSIAFGLDDLSLARAVEALRRLGLETKVYGEGGNKAIHFPKQSMVFKALVEPHVPECMEYKIPFESEGQAGHRRAREITTDKIQELLDAGQTKEQIAETYHVGRSTITRRLTPKLKSGELDFGTLTGEKLRELYIQHVDSEIGVLYGVPEGTIRKMRKEFGIQTMSERQRREQGRPEGQPSLDDLTPERLQELYTQMGAQKIAVLFKVQKPAIRSLLKKWGIKSISKSDRAKAKKGLAV